jgi:hypothetical protein
MNTTVHVCMHATIEHVGQSCCCGIPRLASDKSRPVLRTLLRALDGGNPKHLPHVWAGRVPWHLPHMHESARLDSKMELQLPPPSPAIMACTPALLAQPLQQGEFRLMSHARHLQYTACMDTAHCVTAAAHASAHTSVYMRCCGSVWYHSQHYSMSI